MLRAQILLMVILAFPLCSFAEQEAPTWILTEESLIEQVYKNSTLANQLQANQARSLSQNLDEKSIYQPIWKNEIYYQNSNEKALASFIPVFGPSYGFQTGLYKKFSQGIEMQANLFGDLQSSTDNVIDRAARTGINLQAKFDLWRNFLGRLDQSRLDNTQIKLDKIEIENRLALRSFELDMRKQYWSLVSIQEKIRISEKLLESATVQYKDSLSRKRNFIADATETDRYKAQVASRKATLYSLHYQRDLTQQAMKQYFPNIALSTFVMGPYDRKEKVQKVLTCVAQIRENKKSTWEYTPLDEIIALTDQVYQQQTISDEQLDGIDIALQTELQVSGVDQGYPDSFSDFSSNGKAGFQVGLMVDVPLGKSKKRVKKARMRAEREQFLSDKGQIQANVRAHKKQLLAMVDTLFASMENFQENNQTLSKNVSRIQKKYRQARVDIRDLVLEQDALSQNLLNEVDAHLAVMQVLLDYFKVFTQDPCPLNQMHKAYAKEGSL